MLEKLISTEAPVDESTTSQHSTDNANDYTSNKDLYDVFKINEKLYNSADNADAILQSNDSDDNEASNLDNASKEEEEEIKAMEQIIDELVARDKRAKAKTE